MRLVVGLGNPGPRYAGTRHNVGFRVVDWFAESRGIALDAERFGGRFGQGVLAPDTGPALEIALLEPLAYMNRSGASVRDAVEKLPVEDPARELLVVLDDVDLPFGRLRLRPRGSSGGHRGLEDVIEQLGHGDFPRLRFGVGRPEGAQETADYVLDAFSREETGALGPLLRRAADAVEAALVEGLAPAMSRYNRAEQA